MDVQAGVGFDKMKRYGSKMRSVHGMSISEVLHSAGNVEEIEQVVQCGRDKGWSSSSTAENTTKTNALDL